MSGISRDQLQQFARIGDVELRLQQTDDGEGQIETRDRTWHGRLMRQLKINDLHEDRRDKQVEYGGAHAKVYQALREIYGEEIGEKAFRAGGFGHEGRDGDWITNSNFPITGRQIAKMLQAGDREHAREVARNERIGEWIGAIRGAGEDGAPEVLLGEKVSRPYGRITKEEAYRHLAGDLDHDVGRWLEQSNERHGLWILDLGLDRGRQARIGIHVDRNDPEMLHIRGGRGVDFNIPRSEMAQWLRTTLPENFERGEIESVALYRAQEETAGRVLEHAEQLQPALNGVTHWGDRGVRKWTEGALQVIKDSNSLLRSNVSLPGNTEALRVRVNLQLGEVNRLLNDREGAVTTQTHLDERHALLGRFGGVVGQRLQELGLNDREQQQQIFKALGDDAEAFIAQLHFVDRRSLTEPEARDELALRLATKLDDMLEGMGWEGNREETLNENKNEFSNCLTQLDGEALTPLRQQREETIRPLHGELVRELEKQRGLLEAKAKDLEVAPQPIVQDPDLHGILKAPGSGGTGQSVDMTGWVRQMPLQLRFEVEGPNLVARVPNLFAGVNPETGRSGRYNSRTERALTWDTVRSHNQERLEGDKSGVPGGGKENEISTRILGHTGMGTGTRVGLKVGDEDAKQLSYVSLHDLKELEDLEGNPLSEEQFCALTRFLDDRALQEVYAQAVRRLYPPEELEGIDDLTCRDFAIIVQTSRGDDGQPRFDITFRASMPDTSGGGDIKYQALRQDGTLPEDAPVHSTEGDELLLNLTLHVPFDQLQSERPQVQIDEPGIALLYAPDDWQNALHIDPQNV